MAWVASDESVEPPSGHTDNRPYTVALTGGIASGKSLVSDEFARLGVPVVDTDVIAHEIVEPGQPALEEIKKVFGPNIIDTDGRLKRSKLRKLIFSDTASRKKLESILHPRIRQNALEAVSRVTTKYCVLVIPLLAERASYPGIDRILVVDVDPEIQIERLISSDKGSLKQARQALDSQIGREQRLDLADDVLLNSGTPEQARQEVARLHQKYLKLSENRE